MVEHDYKNYPELTNAQLEEFGFTSPHMQITEDFDASVVKVHDGDTLTLRADFRDFDFPLRLLQIDAPELNEGGEEARDWLKSQILGQRVSIIIDPYQRVGKYGRLLGRVIHGGMDMGEAMMSMGMVKAFGAKDEDKLPIAYKLLRLEQWF